MVNKQIENFKITDTTDMLIVDYSKTAKDWFDTILTIAIGLFCAVCTFVLLMYGLKPAPYITILIGLMFAFVTMVQIASGFSRLFHPTKALIVIDKRRKNAFIKAVGI
jgi:hypothetical protein